MRCLLLGLLSAFAGAAFQYGSVIDAGSSGSRIYLFRWDARSFPSLPPPLSTPVEILFFSLRGVAGVDTPAGRAALPQLLEWARGQLLVLGVSAAEIAATPLFLKATAGMRMLTEEARASAMAEVRAQLAAGPFLFKPSWARTISGEEEGVAGWISVNYMAKLLPGQAGATSGSTLGALDLGGASTQITFAPPAGVDILSSQFDVRLSSAAQASLYTHSFLYYGQNEAIRRINELVVLSSGLPAGATIAHPCFLTGTPSSSLLFNSTLVGGLVTFVGASNWTACKEFVTPLMLRGAQCLTDPRPVFAPWAVSAPSGVTALDWAALQAQRQQLGVAPLPLINPNASGTSCSVGGQYQPPLVPPSALAGSALPVRFSAFSGFSFVYEALGLAYDAPLALLMNASRSFCNLDFSSANETFPGARGEFFRNYVRVCWEHCVAFCCAHFSPSRISPHTPWCPLAPAVHSGRVCRDPPGGGLWPE